MVEYKPLLKQWLSNHPLKHQQVYPLWISEATNYKNKPLGIAGAGKIVEELIRKVDPTKKAKLYTLRHSRATFLAKCGFSLFDLCDYFGWDYNSEQPKTYIHLTARDLSQKISALYDKQPQKDTKILLKSCLRCKEELYTNEPSCPRCGQSTSVADTYLKEIKKPLGSKSIEKIQLEFENFKAELQEQMNFYLNRMQGNNSDVFKKDREEIAKLEPNKSAIIMKNGVKTERGVMFDFSMENIGAVVKRKENGEIKLDENFITSKIKYKEGQNPAKL